MAGMPRLASTDLKRATRALSGSLSQTPSLFLPVSSELNSELSDPLGAGMAGMPRLASCSTVPERCSTEAFCRSTSNCSGVVGGSFGSAVAVELINPDAATTMITAKGAAHRRTDRDPERIPNIVARARSKGRGDTELSLRPEAVRLTYRTGHGCAAVRESQARWHSCPLAC